MKKTTLMMLAMVLLMAACTTSVKEKITGTWRLESIGGQEMPKTEAGLLDFREDGKMIQNLGGYQKEFKWRISEDEKSVYFTGEDGREEKNEILELDNGKMKLNSTDGIIVLTKK